MLDEVRAGIPSAVTQNVAKSGPVDLTDEEIRERMAGNICRCGAYPNIVTAVRAVYGRRTRMRPFTYVRPASIDAAIARMNGHRDAKFLGGGTNLVDLMKMGVERPAQLIDITRLPLSGSKSIKEACGSAPWL